MKVVGKLPHELVQRERAPLPARAGAEPGSVHERCVRDSADAVQQLAELAVEVARTRLKSALHDVQRRQCFEIALAPPAQVHVGAAGRGGVPVVDDNERAVRCEPRIGAITEPESLEQARMGDLGILAPDHDHPRPITDLAERGGRGAA